MVGLDTFRDKGLLNEIHKLLWIEPLLNRGVFDSGWSCREHAFVCGCLLIASGYPATVVVGKAMFIQGPENGEPPVGLGTSPTDATSHAWLGLREGAFDISPNLDIYKPPWRRIRFSGIFADKWEPDGIGSFQSCSSAHEYENQIALATHAEGERRAIYWPQRNVELSEGALRNPLDFTNSPLTDWLRRHHAVDVLVKAVL